MKDNNISLFPLLLALLAAHSAAQTPDSAAAANAWDPNKGLALTSSDGQYSFRMRGRLHLDYVNASLNDENQINTTEVRRAWFDLSGTAGDWYFLHRFDAHTHDQQLESFVEYRGWGESAWVSFGRNKEPFGMSWMTSSNHLAIPERSAIIERFTFGRNTGLLVRGQTSQVGYQVGVFEVGDELLDNEMGETSLNKQRAEKIALSGRLFAPVLQNSFHTLHLGAGYSGRPDQTAYGLELGYLSGSLHVQSEWMFSRPEMGEDTSGYYVELGWFFTPDQLVYNNGVFSNNIAPQGGKGAWQVVARYDNGDGDYADIQLDEGDGDALALALNWFAQKNIRMSASYTFGELADRDGDEFRVRTQFTF